MSDHSFDSKQQTNLIICSSPLQVLIAERIINLYAGERFFGVMLCHFINNKYDYYFQRLQNCCADSKLIYFPQPNRKPIIRGKLRKIYSYWILKKSAWLPIKNFDKVFLGNIAEKESQIILSYINFNSVMTFDDGSANIIVTSAFYQQSPHRRVSTWPCKINYSAGVLRQLSRKHYTIYPNHKNIVSPIEVIRLLPDNITTASSASPKQTLRILLGQPLLEPDWDSSKQLMQQIMAKWQITYYFPHPRDCYQLENVQIIDTDLIFEDYLVMVITQKPDICYEIYTVGSSAAINLMNSKNLKIVLIQVESIDKLPAWYPDLIKLFNEFNIERHVFNIDFAKKSA